MSNSDTAKRFGFFAAPSRDADVAESVTAQADEVVHTNALAQCLALETRDETGKRTLSHISPFDDDNPMHTEDQAEVARYWVDRVMAEHGEGQQISAVLAGGRKGHALSEQLHDNLAEALSDLHVPVRDESNMSATGDSGRAITNVQSHADRLAINTYNNGKISSRDISR